MTSLDAITLEVADLAAAERFYANAFGLGSRLRLRASQEPATGFRGFSLWGYGGVVQAPDGTIWKVATSAKKNTGPATGEIGDVVLLLGATDVAASRQCYVDQGFTVEKSFGRMYVQFAAAGTVKLGLYRRRALAKDAGVAPEGSGSHRIVMIGAGDFTDPDGFAWASGQPAGQLGA
jgi:catechol 2,3-dioxygenase-like lactoylglutathione lyase family enzyme